MKELKIKTRQDYDRLKKIIKLYQKQESPENALRHKKIINSKQEIVGVSMAHIRMIAKSILKAGADEFLNFAKDGVKEEECFEETLIQGLVIAELKDLKQKQNCFDFWVRKIDNWATCDSTVSTMKYLKKDKNKKECFDYFFNLCFGSEEFISRFGIVVLMTYFLEDEYIDRILEMCLKVVSEKYYIQMAQAWLLSFAFMKFKKKTEDLFAKKCLSKFVQNKAISKCRDSFQITLEDKERLKKYRIK